MPDGVLLIRLHDPLAVVQFVSRRRLDDQLHLVLYPDQQMPTVRLSLYELDRVAHQLHQTIVVREFSLAVGHVPSKGSVLLDMPCDVDAALHVPVVIAVTDIPLEESFPHGGLQVVWEQEEQEIEQTVILVCVGFQIHDVGEIQHLIEQVPEEIILLFGAEPRFDNQPLITAAEKTHHIPRAVRIIHTLQDHLIPRQIFRFNNEFGEHEDTLAFQLLKRLVRNPARKGFDACKRILLYLRVILNLEQLHRYLHRLASCIHRP